jgi:hypothetical protein
LKSAVEEVVEECSKEDDEFEAVVDHRAKAVSGMGT